MGKNGLYKKNIDGTISFLYLLLKGFFVGGGVGDSLFPVRGGWEGCVVY